MTIIKRVRGLVQYDDLVQWTHCRQYKIQAVYIHEHHCPIHGSMFRIVLVRPEHWGGQVFLVLLLEPHRDVPIRAKILSDILFLFVPLYKSR